MATTNTDFLIQINAEKQLITSLNAAETTTSQASTEERKSAQDNSSLPQTILFFNNLSLGGTPVSASSSAEDMEVSAEEEAFFDLDSTIERRFHRLITNYCNFLKSVTDVLREYPRIDYAISSHFFQGGISAVDSQNQDIMTKLEQQCEQLKSFERDNSKNDEQNAFLLKDWAVSICDINFEKSELRKTVRS